jgi:AcrR family transcriptional regulator
MGGVRSGMKMSELEDVVRVSRSTIHHYIRIGLVPKADVLGPRRHAYGPRHVEALERVRLLREQGLTIPEIKRRLARQDAQDRSGGAADAAGAAGEADRTRIVEAATQLFLKGSYDAISLTDVAAEAGVSRATIYTCFSGKDELLVECVRHVRARVFPRRNPPGEDRDPADGIRRAWGFLKRYQIYTPLFNLLRNAAASSDPQLVAKARAEYNSIATDAQPHLQALMDEGVFRDLDSEMVSCIIFGALVGIGERLALDDKYSLEDALEVYATVLGRGLRIKWPAGEE